MNAPAGNEIPILIESNPAVSQQTLHLPPVCHKPLRTNPYNTYRDESGKWIVVRAA
jgi:hypothetical protein